MEPAISLNGVSKTFGTTVAVRDLDLVVPRGALYGFIGPNGAGKTTSLRMIMSILFPDRGRVSVLGCQSAQEAKDRISYLPEERGVYRKMKVGAFLIYIARLKGVNDSQAATRVRSWLDRVDLPNVYDKKCEELSKGMLQKVQLIAAILHQPELLILDEPFSGLDPVNTRLLRDIVLDEHRRRCASIGTLGVLIGSEGAPVPGGAGLTTPGSVELQRVLRALVEQAKGYEVVLVASNKPQAQGLEWARSNGLMTWALESGGTAKALPLVRLQCHQSRQHSVVLLVKCAQGC